MQRAKILQENFPETIAFILKELKDPSFEINANAGYLEAANSDIAEI